MNERTDKRDRKSKLKLDRSSYNYQRASSSTSSLKNPTTKETGSRLRKELDGTPIKESSSRMNFKPRTVYNPYKKPRRAVKSNLVKGILKRGLKSNWYLTTARGNLNYSSTFNGPVENGEKLILKRPVSHNHRVTFGPDTVHTFIPPADYNPWDYIHKSTDIVRLLKPYKF